VGATVTSLHGLLAGRLQLFQNGLHGRIGGDQRGIHGVPHLLGGRLHLGACSLDLGVLTGLFTRGLELVLLVPREAVEPGTTAAEAEAAAGPWCLTAGTLAGGWRFIGFVPSVGRIGICFLADRRGPAVAVNPDFLW